MNNEIPKEVFGRKQQKVEKTDHGTGGEDLYLRTKEAGRKSCLVVRFLLS